MAWDRPNYTAVWADRRVGRFLYFLRHRPHPALSGNHLGPGGGPQQPEWDVRLSSPEALPPSSEEETERGQVTDCQHVSMQLIAVYCAAMLSCLTLSTFKSVTFVNAETFTCLLGLHCMLGREECTQLYFMHASNSKWCSIYFFSFGMFLSSKSATSSLTPTNLSSFSKSINLLFPLVLLSGFSNLSIHLLMHHENIFVCLCTCVSVSATDEFKTCSRSMAALSSARVSVQLRFRLSCTRLRADNRRSRSDPSSSCKAFWRWVKEVWRHPSSSSISASSEWIWQRISRNILC